MSYLYSNEIVFRGHPDKVADQISDALLDAYMRDDKNSRCAIETVGGKGKIFITGEVTSKSHVDVESVVKLVLTDIGYDTNYEIINNIGIQSPDIAQGVDIGGAGDQGMMFGYACRETPEMLPTAQVILQQLAKMYDELRSRDKRFLPDGKAQITGYYDDEGKLQYIKDFTISYQNTEEERDETDQIIVKCASGIAALYGVEVKEYHINPTGKFLIGGFEGDAGLTGRKIVVDNYQSFANVGGGAFSGKDPTKVDRSAAYMARNVAKWYLASCKRIEWCEVQVSYAIGLEKPLAIYIRSNLGMIEPMDFLYEVFTPNEIINKLGLRDFKYQQTAAFGHFGNPNYPWEKVRR